MQSGIDLDGMEGLGVRAKEGTIALDHADRAQSAKTIKCLMFLERNTK